jgi:hypothetical protein
MRKPASTSTPHSDEPASSGGYEVGYGRPPQTSRFKPGQSGNPKGRPKAAKNLSTLAREKLQAKVSVREGGRERLMSKAELGVTKLVNRFAESGDPKLLAALQKMEGGEGPTTAAAASPLQREAHASDDAILAFYRAQILADEGGES